MVPTLRLTVRSWSRRCLLYHLLLYIHVLHFYQCQDFLHHSNVSSDRVPYFDSPCEWFSNHMHDLKCLRMMACLEVFATSEYRPGNGHLIELFPARHSRKATCINPSRRRRERELQTRKRPTCARGPASVERFWTASGRHHRIVRLSLQRFISSVFWSRNSRRLLTFDSELKPGQLVKDDFFTLFEAVGALEVSSIVSRASICGC